MPKGIEMEIWLAFLAAQGVFYVRTESSHDVFDNPVKHLRRCITVRSQKDSEVPLLHMGTSLKTLGMQMSDFTKWQKANIGKGGKLKKPRKKPESPDDTSKE